jgi:6-phosphogluconate dehydrogenase
VVPQITAEVLAHADAATGRAFVDVVADAVGQKGTGRWTVQTALDRAPGAGAPSCRCLVVPRCRRVAGCAGCGPVEAAVPSPPRPARGSGRRAGEACAQLGQYVRVQDAPPGCGTRRAAMRAGSDQASLAAPAPDGGVAAIASARALTTARAAASSSGVGLPRTTLIVTAAP